MGDKLDTAVLVDAAFVVKHFRRRLPKGQYPQAAQFVRLAEDCIDHDAERLFRIYVYDSPPYDGKAKHPLHKTQTNFKNKYYQYRVRLLKDLAEHDHVALRLGVLTFRGWRLSEAAAQDLIAGKRTNLPAEDLQPDFKQKCVDMKIGLDVAWLSSKGIVDRIILVANDRDFIPPMKHARREGVQVVVLEWSGRYRVLSELREHADEVRIIREDPAGSGYLIQR